jgi:hypothetical protein
MQKELSFSYSECYIVFRVICFYNSKLKKRKNIAVIRKKIVSLQIESCNKVYSHHAVNQYYTTQNAIPPLFFIIPNTLPARDITTSGLYPLHTNTTSTPHLLHTTYTFGRRWSGENIFFVPVSGILRIFAGRNDSEEDPYPVAATAPLMLAGTVC